MWLLNAFRFIWYLILAALLVCLVFLFLLVAGITLPKDSFSLLLGDSSPND